jgi:tetratricopeptide (TPR) repeat protein
MVDAIWNFSCHVARIRTELDLRSELAAQVPTEHQQSGLADCYILLGPNDILPAKEVYPLAKAAAQKALQPDDALAEAHASLGFVMLLYDWNPAEAEKEFRRSITLDPNYATAHHWYAYDLAAMKRSDEAVAEIREALELDPVSPIINTDVAQILFFARRDDEAIAQCQKTVGLAPEFSQVYWYLGLLYEQKGMFDLAFDAFLKSPFGPSDSKQAAAIRAAYRMSGMKGYWRARLAILQRQSKGHYVSPFTLAVYYIRMGEQDKALENLEQAFDQRYPSMVFVQIEPVFASLRSDPRFVALHRRISGGRKDELDEAIPYSTSTEASRRRVAGLGLHGCSRGCGIWLRMNAVVHAASRFPWAVESYDRPLPRMQEYDLGHWRVESLFCLVTKLPQSSCPI